ncbi:hypothetical protein K431DRAFT_342673 [Polychaeton citri CBS 116435]|uniref:Uncharacterized protein n=1 Tax=Polychaeton citri CBS 116435 TaxID=1314669 RepID=A0A9P4UUJ6_9PEZI|nr:hypothetical protein K431DRAFT_342673 [Polychaeton citri CBS 116435]
MSQQGSLVGLDMDDEQDSSRPHVLSKESVRNITHLVNHYAEARGSLNERAALIELGDRMVFFFYDALKMREASEAREDHVSRLESALQAREDRIPRLEAVSAETRDALQAHKDDPSKQEAITIETLHELRSLRNDIEIKLSTANSEGNRRAQDLEAKLDSISAEILRKVEEIKT